MSDQNNVIQVGFLKQTSVQPVQPDQSSSSMQSRSRDIAMRAGESVREFFTKHGMKLLTALVLIAICYVIVMSFSQMAESDAILANSGMLRTAILSANSLRHNKCKRRGACSKECPFINEQDPRVVICKHSDEVELVYNESVRSNKELSQQINMQLEYVTDEATKKTIAGLLTQQDDSIRSIKEINSCIADLDAAAAKWDTLDVAAINSKERAIGLLAAANAQSYKLTASALNALGLAFVDRISALDQKPETSKIAKYQEILTHAKTQINTLNGQQQVVLSAVSETTYKDAVTVLLTELADSNKITSSMALVLNAHQKLVDSIKDVVFTFSRISDYFNNTIGTLQDSFNNKNPGDELSADNQTSMITDGDYNSVMVKTALGKDIVKNHAKFTAQRSSFDSGGGVPSLRDDDNDLIPWVGFRRPQYFKKNGESMDKSSEPLRQIPSDVPETMARQSFYDFLAPVQP